MIVIFKIYNYASKIFHDFIFPQLQKNHDFSSTLFFIFELYFLFHNFILPGQLNELKAKNQDFNIRLN